MHRFSALSNETAGMLLGLIGVAIFGLTFPATRMAVAELPPDFVALGRAMVAALLAAIWLGYKRLPFPPRSALLPLALVAGGCVVGFPWLSSIALTTVPASHGAVIVGILPLATAAFSALRARGVLIKDVSAMHPLLRNCLRLTVGTADENRAMLQALKECL